MGLRAAPVRVRLSSYVALLRAVNLGPTNRIAMADLRTLCAALGYTDVLTYVQSGNVIFKSRVRDPAKVAKAIEDGIGRDLGLRISVLARTGAEMAKVVGGNPFAGRASDVKHLHVTFLKEAPDRGRARQLLTQAVAPEEVHLDGREVYLHLPGGYGRAALSGGVVEKQLAVPGTTRNWNTVTKLAELAGA